MKTSVFSAAASMLLVAQCCLWAGPDDKETPQTLPARRVRRPPVATSIKLVEQSVGRMVNNVLVLAGQDTGQTAKVSVGQTIIVQLAGDKASGWQWKFDKLTSDAVVQVGQPRQIQPDVPEGTIGGKVGFLFPFRAVKSGTAVLTLVGARPWEWEKGKVQTFKLTFEVAPDAKGPAAARLKALKGSIRNFTLRLAYHGPQDKPFYELQLDTAPRTDKDKPPGEPLKGPFLRAVSITPAQAARIVDHLAESLFLDRSADAARNEPPKPKEPCYMLRVSSGKDTDLREDLGWDAKMIETLQALGKVLEGEAAKAMDMVLQRLSGLQKQWQEEKARSPDTPQK